MTVNANPLIIMLTSTPKALSFPKSVVVTWLLGSSRGGGSIAPDPERPHLCPTSNVIPPVSSCSGKIVSTLT